jgi:hypothetical protein
MRWPRVGGRHRVRRKVGHRHLGHRPGRDVGHRKGPVPADLAVDAPGPGEREVGEVTRVVQIADRDRPSVKPTGTGVPVAATSTSPGEAVPSLNTRPSITKLPSWSTSPKSPPYPVKATPSAVRAGRP